MLPHPTKEQFKLFLLRVLSDFNYFETHNGIYKQLHGVQMGSSLAPLIANLFIGCLERSVIRKLTRQGHIITWLRYADDNLTIIKKGSFDHILNELNSWDPDISYSFEKMTENKLNFLSTTIFVKNEEIQFQPFRKAGLDSILSNYKQAVIAQKYLISTIYTLLHHAEYSSSTREIFIQDLKNQKEIFLRNAYPEKLVDEIFAKYLINPEKPPQPEVTVTCCIDYTHSKIEYYLKNLNNKIKSFIPTFNIRFQYKSIRVESIFTKDSKPMTSKLDTCNCIYQFRCLCNKQYVGMTKRTLRIRATEHRNPSSVKKTYHHINQCPTYISKWQEFERKNVPPNSQVTFIKKMRDKFFYGPLQNTPEKFSKLF